jgi:hypothetical protein
MRIFAQQLVLLLGPAPDPVALRGPVTVTKVYINESLRSRATGSGAGPSSRKMDKTQADQIVHTLKLILLTIEVW